MDKSACPRGLGIFSQGNTIYLYYTTCDDSQNELRRAQSSDGFSFQKDSQTVTIIDNKKNKLACQNLNDFRIAEFKGTYYLTYKQDPGVTGHLMLALSSDLRQFKTVSLVDSVRETGMIVPNVKIGGDYVMVAGELSIFLAFSKNLTDWRAETEPILKPRPGQFDDGELMVATVVNTQKGILVYYYVRKLIEERSTYALGAALLDTKDPKKIIWRSDNPVLTHMEEFTDKRVHPVGLVVKGELLYSYWNIKDHGIVAVAHPQKLQGRSKSKGVGLVLTKLTNNPILEPIRQHFWESKATFNPAAIFENGKVHLIYRAVGDSDVSVLGYATSRDGVTIDERSKAPIYMPSANFELNREGAPVFTSPFASGGGAYGGTEDPRITKIDDRMYMTYVAYDGSSPPRVALTSMSVDDFNNQRWNWSPPVLISPPGVVDKNACILPEKIDGKYVIFHRIYPNILIDYVDSLDFNGRTWLKGEHIIPPRPHSWDSRKVGIGPPPIATDDGWLMIYHAVGEKDSARYKMGAMLLDRQNPTRVLYRSKYPILEPVEKYENEGFKYGVAYPCGAVTINNELMVYYGGADMVVCAAKAPLDDFLYNLKHAQMAQLVPVVVHN